MACHVLIGPGVPRGGSWDLPSVDSGVARQLGWATGSRRGRAWEHMMEAVMRQGTVYEIAWCPVACT